MQSCFLYCLIMLSVYTELRSKVRTRHPEDPGSNVTHHVLGLLSLASATLLRNTGKAVVFEVTWNKGLSSPTLALTIQFFFTFMLSLHIAYYQSRLGIRVKLSKLINQILKVIISITIS